MNSVIISFLVSHFKILCNWFSESVIYKIFLKIYSFFSTGWQRSIIVSALKKDFENIHHRSVVYKLYRVPFIILEFLQNKLSSKIKNIIDKSIFCYFSKIFINSFMAINTRFFGIMITGACLSYISGNLVKGIYPKATVIIMVLAILLSFADCNIMGFLNSSAIVSFKKKALGFADLDFHFYNEDYIKGNTKIILALIIGLITGAVALYSMMFAFLVPVGLFGFLMILYCPLFGVFCTVFSAPIVPTMVLAGLCIMTAVSYVIKAVKTGDYRWKISKTGLGILVLLTILFVSSILSFAPLKSTVVWIMYLVFGGFYFIIINSIKTRQQLYSLLKVFVFSGFLVALYGIMQYLFGWNTTNAWIDEEMFEDATVRVYSTLGNPNVLGEYLLLTLPVSAVFMIKYKWNEWAKYVFGIIFVVMALCMVFTQSRGCWLGFILCTCVFITFYKGKLWGLLPIVFLALPFILPQTIVDRIMSIGNMEDTSTSYRVFIWMGTLGMLKHYWIGGIGMGEGAFNLVYPFYSYNAIIAPHSHNLYLQLTVEAGICALIVFLTTMVVFLKQCSKTYSLREKTNSIISLAIASGVIGFLLQSMFDYTFYNYRVMAIFFMVLGFGTVLNNVTGMDTDNQI